MRQTAAAAISITIGCSQNIEFAAMEKTKPGAKRGASALQSMKALARLIATLAQRSILRRSVISAAQAMQECDVDTSRANASSVQPASASARANHLASNSRAGIGLPKK
jgi:hypothetical protein